MKNPKECAIIISRHIVKSILGRNIMGNLKILLFDLDGTLLRNDKTVSEYTLEILSKCKECGQGVNKIV